MRGHKVILFLVVCLSGCSTIPPAILKGISSKNSQVIIVSASKQSHSARLSFWQKENHQWQKYFGTSAVVGRNGVAPLNDKKEGDGRTPQGTFDLQTVFGYAPTADTRLNYMQVKDNDFWVDDPKSSQYNQWVKGTPKAGSFEVLRRKDGLYKLAVVIEYNTHPIVAGAGSAIFMHIWRRYDHPTAGCVALSERNLRKIVKHLDSTQNPVVIIQSE